MIFVAFERGWYGITLDCDVSISLPGAPCPFQSLTIDEGITAEILFSSLATFRKGTITQPDK